MAARRLSGGAVTALLAAHWRGCGAVREEKVADHNHGSTELGEQRVEISVAIENDTPYDVDDFLLLHKYNGLPKEEGNTHVRLFQGVRSGTTSAPKKVATMVGLTALRNDWWLASWRFKRDEGSRCPCCVKEDGTCETYVSNPDNAVAQFFTDPMTYVKMGGFVANVLVTAFSFGTATALSVALTGAAANLTASAITSDANTDGFKGFSLTEADYHNDHTRGVPVRVRVSPVYENGQMVSCIGYGDIIPLGAVGIVLGFDPTQTRPLFVTFAGHQKVFDFDLRSCRFTYRIGDIVNVYDPEDILDNPDGEVIGYTTDGKIRVKFDGIAEVQVFGHHELVVSSSMPNAAHEKQPRFNIDILEYKSTVMPRDVRMQVNRGPTSPLVRESCTLQGEPTPCLVNAEGGAEDEGEDVPISVVNKASRRIKSWSVIHKFNSLAHPVHIVDSDAPLDVGASSYRRPATGELDTSIVRTQTGMMAMRNDWWTVAWNFEGDETTECEVATAMDDGFLKELISNPGQKLLNIGVSVAGSMLNVPVLWSGAINQTKHAVEHYVRNELALQAQTKPSFRLFGVKLLNMLCKGSSVRGFLKCNIKEEDIKAGKNGQPISIEIHDDHVEIITGGGAEHCQMQISPMSCVHEERCLTNARCEELMARTTFSRSSAAID